MSGLTASRGPVSSDCGTFLRTRGETFNLLNPPLIVRFHDMYQGNLAPSSHELWPGKTGARPAAWNLGTGRGLKLTSQDGARAMTATDSPMAPGSADPGPCLPVATPNQGSLGHGNDTCREA